MPDPSSDRLTFETLARRAVGKPDDWGIRRPALRLPRPGRWLVGPLLVLASVAVAWPAFSGVQGEEGSVAFSLFIGAVAIVLMAWSFLLAVRVRVLELLFGGLDSMYRVHRWAGGLAVVAMFLHTSVEAEIEGAFSGRPARSPAWPRALPASARSSSTSSSRSARSAGSRTASGD